MRRPTAPTTGNGSPPQPGQAMMGLVDLYAFLTDALWDDGKPRQLGTITVFTQDGRWKVSLNDRDRERFAIVTGPTLEETFDTADAKLGADEVEWRESGGSRRRHR